MIKQIFTSTLILAASFTAAAEADVLRILLNDGTSQTINVSDIQEMNFEDAAEGSQAAKFAGVWNGTVSLIVGGTFTYSTGIAVTITANETDGTISISYPQYSLDGTMMGDLTLGEVTVPGLEWDETKGGFYRSYGGLGITQHLKAVRDGNTSMDSDYPLNDPSTILVTLSDDGKVKIENPFKLGAMPLPLTSVFEGVR